MVGGGKGSVVVRWCGDGEGRLWLRLVAGARAIKPATVTPYSQIHIDSPLQKIHMVRTYEIHERGS